MSFLDQCGNFFDADPRVLGVGHGRILAAGIFFTLAFSTVAFLLYQRKSAATLHISSSSQQSRFSSSTIFPAFELFLYLLVFVNIFTGILIISTDYYVGNEWTAASFLFNMAITMQHMVCEGMVFMLMQKGCGLYAFKRAGYYAVLWGIVTYLFLMYTFFRVDGAFEVFSIWNSILLLFYLILWFAPMDYLFRRPAAILFAKVFSIFHGLTFSAFVIEYLLTDYSVPCAFFFNFIFLEPFLQPVFAYYILLEDCRWWQGRGRFSQAATISTNQTMSPLHGFDVSLQSATALAKVVDQLGGAATATLISFSQLSFDKKHMIGYGSFSKVYKGKFKAADCAVKLVFTMDLTEEDICRVAAEATILSSVKSINVVKIFGVTVLPPSVCIVLELCTYGSLSDVLRPPKALSLTFQDQLFLCLGCARGVAALHALSDSVIHRDIKSFNFLVDHQLNAKLADLELGADTDMQFEIKNIDDNALFDYDFLANWIAPEVLQQAPYTQASDIYAMSLVFWEIFSKEIPYSEKNNESTRSAIINNHRPDINHVGIQNCPDVIRNLIVAGWSEEPLVRPVASDFESVIESIWLTHGVSGLSVLEANSEIVLSKLAEAGNVSINNDLSKSDMTRPTVQGNNPKLMALSSLYDAYEAIEANDIWKIVRNLGESAMIVTGFSPYSFMQCSVEWEQVTGYLNENLFGYTMRDLLSPTSPESFEAYDAFLLSVKNSNSGHCVVTILTPNRTEVTVSMHASPIFKSQYQKTTESVGDGVETTSSWSGAVPYARTVAFFKLTVTVLTQVTTDEDFEHEDGSLLTKILRKLSVDGSSSRIRSNSFFSRSRTSGRSSKRSSGRSNHHDDRDSKTRISKESRGSGYTFRTASRESRGSGRYTNNWMETGSVRTQSIAEHPTLCTEGRSSELELSVV